jgi:ABC-type amino acid transport substrate-binding protein
MLLRQELDALFMDRPAAERLVDENPGRIRILDENLGLESYAFAVNPNDPDVLSAIDRVLTRLREDGRLEMLAVAHGLRK